MLFFKVRYSYFLERGDMSMQVSRVTSKGQTTIPVEIRQILRLEAGDILNFEIVDHKVILSKLGSFDTELYQALAATLSEWDSPEDDEAFNDL
jgi:AbrB family looped-hinge helix DNA binding protein